MAETPEDKQFGSSEALLKFLRQKVDDIDSVIVPINSSPIHIRDPQGRARRIMSGAGAWIKLCDGSSFLISRDDAEMLINDGVLQRLNIKCALKALDELQGME